MIKRLDRVKLTARAAAVFNNNKRPSMFDWTARRGVVERVTANKANVVVLWDGRKSMDVVPIRSVQLEPEVGTSPNRALTVNRDDVFIWLSLFWFVTLCGLVIWMLLSA